MQRLFYYLIYSGVFASACRSKCLQESLGSVLSQELASSGLAAEIKGLWEGTADCGKTDAATKSAHKERRKRRASAGHKGVITLEEVLAKAKVAPARPVDFAARSETGAKVAQAGLQRSKIHLGEVEK